jgi:hypothetical protein
MSRLRPTLITTHAPSVSNGTAYLMILNAVKTRKGLIHGHLSKNGEYCAIGSYFHVNNVPLQTTLVDEVAAMNDSMPALSLRQRRLQMIRWLRWKCAQAGMTFVGRKTKKGKR